MDTSQWKEVSALFHQLVDTPAPEREKLLSSKQISPQVRQEACSLLEALEGDPEFLEKPAEMGPASLPDNTAPFSVGMEIGDFRLERVLGSGSFATVYLAYQISLDRHVAVKVTPDVGTEAKMMAPLEHDHIVRVFSQTLEPTRSLRLLCMQFVPGTTLEEVLQQARTAQTPLSGKLLVSIIDSLSLVSVSLSPSALKDRERLESLDYVEAVMWWGTKLADALAFAHARGILHLDVKPSNILLTQYGRPLLTDFNISFSQTATETPQVLGGTLHYMAPEQEGFFQEAASKEKALKEIDHRADIFSLGVVLREMLTAQAGNAHCENEKELKAILQRCLERDPKRRFHQAQDVASALEACLEKRGISKELPEHNAIGRLAAQAPIGTLVFITLAANLAGSVINISYNALNIVSRLNPAQKKLFNDLVIAFNPVVYAICLWMSYRYVVPLRDFLRRPETFGSIKLSNLRLHVLDIPVKLFWVVSVGWWTGAVLFPLGLHLGAGPIRSEVILHFLVSFAVSWLIAVTYTFLYSQTFLVRTVYLRLFGATEGVRAHSAFELAGIPLRIKLFQFMAGLAPSIGAMLIVLSGPHSLTIAQMRLFQMLICFTIAISMYGFVAALRGADASTKTQTALTGIR